MVRYVKKALSNLFDFNDRERKGAVTVVLLIACTSGIRIWLACQKPVTEEIDFKDLELQLSLYLWQENLAKEEHGADFTVGLPEPDPPEAPLLYNFDPNTVTKEELAGMGLDPRLAQTLINYRSKGGVFRTREDLKKIYGMNEEEFNRISPYVRIREPSPRNVLPGRTEQLIPFSSEAQGQMPFSDAMSRSGSFQTELNAADTVALIRLKGIGPVLAARIVKYRNLLGGFAQTKQLGEVYGISDSLLTILQNAVYADTSLLERIDINHAEFLQLSRHPYIGGYYAEGIVRYREFNGSIQSMEELIASGLLPEDRAQRLKAYLVF